MTTSPHPNSHLHFFNHHTGRPRFHFDEASDAAAAAAAAAAKPPAWHAGVEAETLGFWQNKGLPLDDPKAFAGKLTELYRQAEKFIGVPPDQVVKLPKADAKPEDLRAFYERLGAPKEAKDYDLSAVKDEGLAATLRSTAHERGLTKDTASALASAVAKALDSKTTTDNAATTATLDAQRANLQKNWGDKYAYNHLQAIEGARKLGIEPDAVKALEGVIGFDKVMEAMRKIGANTRESTFVEGGQGGQDDVTTREGAMSRKQELMADPAWADRYLKGGMAEKREMDRINTMIDG